MPKEDAVPHPPNIQPDYKKSAHFCMVCDKMIFPLEPPRLMDCYHCGHRKPCAVCCSMGHALCWECWMAMVKS